MKCINAVHKKTRDFILAFFYVGMTFFVQNCLCAKLFFVQKKLCGGRLCALPC